MESPSRHHGFTLIELLVTISIMAILVKLAVPPYRSFVVNQQLATVSSEFFASLLQARSEAMRQGKAVVVGPIASGSWSSGWRIFVDNDGTGLYSSAQTLLVDGTPALPNSVTIDLASGKTTGPFAAPTPFFAFAATGFSKNYPSMNSGGLANGKLWLTASETSRSRVIVASNTGRVRLCDPRKDANQTNPCST